MLVSSLGLSVDGNLEFVPGSGPNVDMDTVTDTLQDSTFEFVRGLQKQIHDVKLNLTLGKMITFRGVEYL